MSMPIKNHNKNAWKLCFIRFIEVLNCFGQRFHCQRAWTNWSNCLTFFLSWYTWSCSEISPKMKHSEGEDNDSRWQNVSSFTPAAFLTLNPSCIYSYIKSRSISDIIANIIKTILVPKLSLSSQQPPSHLSFFNILNNSPSSLLH